MSWWDTSGLTNFASQATKALKNAQKKIDKVLDIDEGDESSQTSQQSKPKDQTSSWSTDAWSSWSMSAWDTSPSSSSAVFSKEKPSSSSQKDKSPTRKSSSKTSVFTASESDSQDSESSNKLSWTRERSSEKLESNEENIGKSVKTTESSEAVDNNIINVTENLKSTDTQAETLQDNNTEEKTQQSSDSLLKNKNLLAVEASLNSSSQESTLSNIGSFDRLSPLSVCSEETLSSYEKVQNTNKCSAEDIGSLHFTASSNDKLDSSNSESDNLNFFSETSNLDLVPSNEQLLLDDSDQPSAIKMLSTDTIVLGDGASSHLNSEISLNQSHIKESDSKYESALFVESHYGQSENTSQIPDIHIEQQKFPSELSDFVDSHFEQQSKSRMSFDLDEHVIETESTVPSIHDSKEDSSIVQLKCESSTDHLISDIVMQNKNLELETENKIPHINTVSLDSVEKVSDDKAIDKHSTPLSPVMHHVRSSSFELHDDQPSSPLTTSSSGEGSKLDSSMDTDDTVVDHSVKADTDSIENVSPSSSYVKCMIEEAMDDNVKIEDNSSDGYSVGKSECSRSTGGHESGDEVDTTTSSDIEIISTPTSNGESNKFIDLSPLKIALQKTARRNDGTHRRNDSHDSQSSSSSHSRDGHGEQMSPGRDTDSSEDGVEMKIMSEEAKIPLCGELPPLDEEVADPYNTQKLLKKLAEMAEVLQAREDKLVVLSKESMDLMETNNILRNQLQQLEESRAIEMEDVEQVTAEFTHRLSESEKLCQQAIREKEAMKKQFEEMKTDFLKKISKLDSSLQEKEQTVAELLQEGEKLSKQQLQSNTLLKKLRSKEKETESLVTGYRKKIDEQTVELEHLKKVLDSKEEMEKKQTEAINQLNAAVQKQERELTKLKGIETDSSERVRGLQAALDNSYKEIAELNKSNAALDSQAQAAALSQEMHIREELKATLEREQLNFRHEKEALIMQIEDLRLSMQRMEKEHNRREDMLRQEISDLQVQLQEDEARNQDLSHSVTTATRPLLRQIENLQSTFAAQSLSWEKVEKNLTDRLVEAQTQLATVTERERSSSEKLMDMHAQITSLESQNSHLRQDKSQLNAQQEILKAKIAVLEDAKNSEAAQLEAIKQQMSHDMAEIRKEKVFLETQLDMEKTKLEQEKKKFLLAQEQITQLERDIQRPKSRESTHSPVSISRQESVASFAEPPNLMLSSLTQDDIDRNWMFNTQKTSLYESLRQSGATNLLENLQSQLKLREGEIIQLQSDIQQLERTRESMARELVNLTNQNESLEEKIKELPHIQEQLKDINQRYNALLQMYGEKVEEADELRLDLNDVKEMYKMQIDHLLAK